MSDALKYREHAEICLKIAQETIGAGERASWISMAQQWLQSAQEEEAKQPPKE